MGPASGADAGEGDDCPGVFVVGIEREGALSELDGALGVASFDLVRCLLEQRVDLELTVRIRGGRGGVEVARDGPA